MHDTKKVAAMKFQRRFAAILIHLFTQKSGQSKAKAAQTRAQLSSGEGWGSVGHRLSKAYAHSRGGAGRQALLLSIYQHKCLTNKPPRRTPGTLDGKRN